MLSRITHRFLSLSSFLACSIATITIGGCGGEDNGVLVPVYGTVNYNGAPLTKGDIEFIPEQGGNRGGHGTIGPDGKYTLSSYGANDGVHPGKYKVTVSSRGEDLPYSGKDKKRPPMEEDMQGSGPLLIPSRYTNPMESGLTADVATSGSNSFIFELKGEPDAPRQGRPTRR